MRNTIHLLTCLFAAAFCTAGMAGAQVVGSDFTDYLSNPGFEGGIASENTHPNGGFVKVPEGWVLLYDLPGWADVWAGPTNDVNAPVYEGAQYFNCWSGEVREINLSQTIKLPVGAYELTAMMRMTNNDPSLLGNQRIYAKVGDRLTESKILSEEGVGTGWDKLDLVFAIFNEGDSVTIGASSLSDTKNSRGWFQLDDVRITYYGDPAMVSVTILQSKIAELYDEIQSLSSGDWITGGGIKLIDTSAELFNEYGVLTDLDKLNFALDSLTAIKTEILLCDELSEELWALIEREYILLNEMVTFPGVKDLREAVDEAIDYLGFSGKTPEGEDVYSPELKRAIQNLEKADRTYRLTEPASADSPADYTWMIQSANFTKTGGDPSVLQDAVSTGWELNNVAVDGDFKLATIGGLNCWNNWSMNFTSMDVYQDLIVPSGIYSVECETTTDGPVTDNHAYVKSTAGIAVSPAATYCYVGNNAIQEATWEKMVTGKVFVGNDGKLRIGFASTSGRNGSSGWFCITNYVLKYYGNSATGYEDALAQKIADAEGMCDSLILAGELNKLQSAIEVGKAAVGKDLETIEAAFATLNVAMDLVPLSYHALKSYYEDRESILAGLEAAVQNDPSGDLIVAVVALQDGILEADTTTYHTADNLKAALHSFASYIKLYDTAPAYMGQTDLYTTEAIQKLKGILEDQAGIIEGSALSKSVFDKLTVECRMAINELRTSLEPGETTDFSFLIINPDITVPEGADNGRVPEGWTISQNTGNPISRGAHYSADTENTYLDSWAGTAGQLVYTAKQQVIDLPNGTYRLTCVTRSTGEGLTVFASAKDTIKVEVPVNGDEGGSVWVNAPEGSVEKNAHEGIGFGWNEVTVDHIVVWCNSMVIGVSNDPKISGKKWDGYWFSCDEFRLTYLSRDWNVGIEDVNAGDESALLKVYASDGYIVVEGEENYSVTTLSGSPVSTNSQLVPGLYIVRAGAKTAKVLVK